MATDLGETEAGLALVAANAGDIKSVAKINTSGTCQSCGATIPQVYCGQCGQKNDDLRRSLWRLVTESLGGIFSFESRMWRTWGALLLKPGKVASEYANGARSRYSPPIRVYLVVSFLFFGFLVATQTNLFALSVHPKASIETPKNQNEEEAVVKISGLRLNDYSYKLLFFQTQKKFEALVDHTVTDEIVKTMQDYIDAENLSSETSSDAVSDADSSPSRNYSTQLLTLGCHGSCSSWFPLLCFWVLYLFVARRPCFMIILSTQCMFMPCFLWLCYWQWFWPEYFRVL